MDHWVQYHSPERMGCGVEMVDGPPYSILTSKADGNPIGDVVWLVGLSSDEGGLVRLSGWFIVDDVSTSPNPDFLYEYSGTIGALCNPMPVISDERWYRQLLRLTGNYRYGFTKVKARSVINGLRAAAASAGCPLQET